MDLELFREILETDSTSGSERRLAEFLERKFLTGKNRVERFEVGDGTLNLLFSWGRPRVFFCSHLDTVPPYLPPVFETDKIRGRGACDAKGQFFAMFEACKSLEHEGFTDFGLLLLAGEETGSFGAKAYTRDCEGGELVIVGEPTDNFMVSAAKGTRAFGITIKGKPCHSGYPHLGESAVERFVDFMNILRSQSFPKDELLGDTTYNIGKLHSDNAQNILSPELSFRLYFRTTFASYEKVLDFMESMRSETVEITDFGGDTPMKFKTMDEFETKPVAFGSDAPQLHKFKEKILCGPGSIFVAHTKDEFITIQDLHKAVNQYIKMYKTYINEQY